MRKTIVFIFSLFLSTGAVAETYPTMETVRMVINCMQEVGGRSEEALYTCSCRHDVISSELSFQQYEQGRLYERFSDMPGKRGGLFRDAEDAKVLFTKLRKAREKAARACPVVKHINAPSLEEGERVTDEEME